MHQPPLLIWSLKLGQLFLALLGRSLHKFKPRFLISLDPVASLGARSRALRSASTTGSCEARYDEPCQTGFHSSQWFCQGSSLAISGQTETLAQDFGYLLFFGQPWDSSERLAWVVDLSWRVIALSFEGARSLAWAQSFSGLPSWNLVGQDWCLLGSNSFLYPSMFFSNSSKDAWCFHFWTLSGNAWNL